MSELYQSLAHSKWDCKYHVVFVPKRRRKAIFGSIRRQLGMYFTLWPSRRNAKFWKGILCRTMCTSVLPYRRSIRSPR